MKRIYKYELKTTDIQKIEMHQNAEILCIKSQNEIPCIWAIIDTNEILIKRTFIIYGTGHELSENEKRQYIGTYQLYNGGVVFHCFEKI